ncbi:BQ5605_C035g11398 [Microbotryum silenes-dioicae]|uniref:BQ5605_C035g11398 protein n=1 Tax=Microbotryum silenes-dioicae TaxID=796604 RepID=A0A2X0N2D1_9BASI|nr:BQ5605_C035g11398 [Microbotryum silenes-dioicae]
MMVVVLQTSRAWGDGTAEITNENGSDSLPGSAQGSVRLQSERQKSGKDGGRKYNCGDISTSFFFFLTGAHKLQSFGLAGTATKRAKGGYKATTASSWVKVKPLRAKSAAQIKTRRAPNADSNGR